MLYVNPLAQPDVLYAQNPQKAKEESALRELEQQFAKMLIDNLNSASDNPLFPETPLKRMHRQLFNDMAAAEWARTGQLGIADTVREQLSILESQGDWRREMVEAQLARAAEAYRR